MKPNITRVALIVGLILLIPVFGNLYVEGWNWSLFDFIVMGTLLFVVGLAIDFAARNVADPTHKVLAIGAIVLAFLALWTEMAVGAVSQLLAFVFG
jgi:hypothetical protein